MTSSPLMVKSQNRSNGAAQAIGVKGYLLLSNIYTNLGKTPQFGLILELTPTYKPIGSNNATRI
ncbi:MAG: hypothetical protein HC849_18845 [Oscillatoriales cyanobacterium RU_3_3]|nr:hypothetical protein [Microcoleus sp. SU_5_6]NJL68320.1 hypothetical protein [Microcoleus sp. SM1_3_4]NJM61789.1 hypothetical protein [Oscillatoriales cyanobacterium RU_3_3]NJR21269.1 hypothetical protein [Richelia sp. CSU_2_1]